MNIEVEIILEMILYEYRIFIKYLAYIWILFKETK